MRIPVGVFLGIPVGRFPGLACADRAGPGEVHSQFFDYLLSNKLSKGIENTVYKVNPESIFKIGARAIP